MYMYEYQRTFQFHASLSFSLCPSPIAFISIYLIDSVSGGVVFHTTHKQAAGPVHLVHSENWIVVSHSNSHQIKRSPIPPSEVSVKLRSMALQY